LYKDHIVKVITPAYNEAHAIAKVIADAPDWIDQYIVVDNGSTDDTAMVAQRAGATVVSEPQRGYGKACLAGIAALGRCDIVVFIDGDYSDYPVEMALLVDPIVSGQLEMVIGSRVTTTAACQALTLQQRFGNALACFLMKCFWKSTYTDLGPYRAITHRALRQLAMCDENYGWTIEMQIKALRGNLAVKEVAVQYRERIGVSKISGTVQGVIGAGTKIIYTIFRQALKPSLIHKRYPNHLIIFTRYPQPGNTKTRLIPDVGALAAAHLQAQMTHLVVRQGMALNKKRPIYIEVAYDGGNQEKMKSWLGDRCDYVVQVEGDLGARMQATIQSAYDKGGEYIVVIGSDCPGIDQAVLANAYHQLITHDVVIGPTDDGGYYLIGMRMPYRELFAGVQWGSDTVFRDTCCIAKNAGLRMAVLSTLCDVDYATDLPIYRDRIEIDLIFLSVIIPTLHDEALLAEVIHSVKQQGVEVIVSFGDDQDGNIGVATSLGCVVVIGSRGRSIQMNAAARIAKGEVLLFLHGDSVVSKSATHNYAQTIFDLMLNHDNVYGAFRFKTDYLIRMMTFITTIVNLRTKLLQNPYGDQGIFVRKSLFETVGGYCDTPIGEDLLLVHKLRGQGKFCFLDHEVITSGRRWRKQGIIKTTIRNQLVALGLLLKIPPGWLQKLY